MKDDQEIWLNSTTLDAVGLGQKSFESAMKIGAAWMNTTNEIQSETIRFFGERLKKDMQMPAKFAACGSPFDVYQEQVEFASALAADYADESRKIAGMLSEAIEKGQPQLTVIRP